MRLPLALVVFSREAATHQPGLLPLWWQFFTETYALMCGSAEQAMLAFSLLSSAFERTLGMPLLLL